MPPVTTSGQWSPPSPVLTTVRARLRSGIGIGRGYGVLHHLAEREPSLPASRSRPPLPSDSEDSLSDITVIDIGLETDAAVMSFHRYSDISEPWSPSAAASLDRAAAMASATLSTSAAAEGASADEIGIPLSLNLASFIDVSGTSHSDVTEGSGPLGGVGPSVLGAVTSPDGTCPPGRNVDADSVVCDPGLEDPVRDADVPAGVEGAGLDAVDCPDLSGMPEVDDRIDPTGQGLSPTPEGTSESLPCGQRMVTPKLSDSASSSFEIISDTESEKRPVRRTAPASEALGTLGGGTGADTERPPLRFDDLFALARSAPVETYDVVAENIREEFQTVHDRDTLTALLMAMATARAATAAEVYQGAVQHVGDGQATPSAFLELVRHLDDIRQHHVMSD